MLYVENGARRMGRMEGLSGDEATSAMNRKKAVYALAMLLFAGISLGSFILAGTEQSLLSSGSAEAARISLQDLMAQGPGKNKHIELTDFYFGKQYVYTAKVIQFHDVYVPVFP